MATVGSVKVEVDQENLPVDDTLKVEMEEQEVDVEFSFVDCNSLLPLDTEQDQSSTFPREFMIKDEPASPEAEADSSNRPVVAKSPQYYHCYACKRKFKTKTTLMNHIETDYADQACKNSCRFCKKPFHLLKRHLQSHLKEKPFRCGLCPRSYARKFHLETHLRTHSGLKPFQCQMCKKEFTTKSNLKIHSEIHEGRPKFKCESCGREFLRKCNLQVHGQQHERQLNLVIYKVTK